MKNFIIATAVVGASAFVRTSEANAQTQASIGFDKNTIERMTGPADSYLFGGEEISPRAQKSFAKSYKNITVERWAKIRNGYSASFTLDNRKNVVFYDSKGRWFGSVVSYTETKLPFEVRDLVKSKFYDYSIFFVEEVETVDSNGIPTYLIHLEDKANIKLVRVSDGQMETWKEYVKN